MAKKGFTTQPKKSKKSGFATKAKKASKAKPAPNNPERRSTMPEGKKRAESARRKMVQPKTVVKGKATPTTPPKKKKTSIGGGMRTIKRALK